MTTKTFLCIESLVLVKILVCVKCFLHQRALLPEQTRTQHGEAGRAWLLTQLLIKRFIQFNYQIISKINTVSLFTAAKKKREKINNKRKVFTSSVFLLTWNKGAVYIQNTKYLRHPQQGDLQYCIFGWELEAIIALSQYKIQPTRVFRF